MEEEEGIGNGRTEKCLVINFKWMHVKCGVPMQCESKGGRRVPFPPSPSPSPSSFVLCLRSGKDGHHWSGDGESLNASYLSPYLDSLGSDFTNGANFAVAGATTLRKFNSFSLDVQVLQFLRFRAGSLLLTSKGYTNQVSEEEFRNALYIIDIGQNDLFASFIDLLYEQVIQSIPTFIAVIKSAVWDIYKSGGKNFWIHNTGPLGCLPQKLATISARNATSDYDPYGCLFPLNNAAKQFNRQLKALCQKLRSEMIDATIVYVDVYSVKYHLIANSARYGFENPLMACCGHGGPPYNYDPTTRCGNSSVTACDPGLHYVSWDGIHHTEAANSIFAASILSSKFSTPHTNLNFFCAINV
ncbi:hypothetical protein CRG98_046453 [Punica granatum]|uniref:GDSL esterase/lipase At1g09390-like n=1 Tax=Punica granatum TaxID=22663 RepID=A0A2I0HN20_PUNGR|nr:hypothetical protein CRG98_046453 [Punica granatum]